MLTAKKFIDVYISNILYFDVANYKFNVKHSPKLQKYSPPIVNYKTLAEGCFFENSEISFNAGDSRKSEIFGLYAIPAI